MGDLAAAKAFAIVILGGLGNVTGATVGGFILAFAEELGAGYISSGYRDAMGFLLIILILLIQSDRAVRAQGADRVSRYLAAGFWSRSLASVPLWLHDFYFLHVLITTGIFIIAAMSLNLLLGYTGQLSLGHVAFFGIGAYTSALVSLGFEVHVLPNVDHRPCAEAGMVRDVVRPSSWRGSPAMRSANCRSGCAAPILSSSRSASLKLCASLQLTGSN